MLSRIVRRMALTTVLFMLIAAPFSAAFANPPERWYWEGAGTDPALVNCGDFVIDGEWSAWERGRNFSDRDGSWTGTIVNYHFLGTVTNRETGQTIRDEGYFTSRIDPDSNTVMEAGLGWNLNVPGHGVVALSAGSLVFDANTLEILHEGGPHQVLDGLDVWGPNGVLCTYLEG